MYEAGLRLERSRTILNPRYRETFRQHRLLFLLPVFLGAVFGLLVALGSPTLYRSDATLAFKSLDTASTQFGTPPAAQNQAMLTEMLATRSFVDDVAEQSPLESYLRTHTSMGWGPTTLLKRALKGPPTLEDRIVSSMSPKRVTSTLPGSDFLEISFQAPDPTLARKTLKVLISQFLRWRTKIQGNALAAATQAFTKARNQLTQTQTELDAYTRAHPASTTNGDLELKTLRDAQLQAVRRLGAATNVLNNASAAVSGGTGLPTTVSVVDEPSLPIGPTTGKKRLVELTLIGGFVGALISFGIIVLMSRSGTAPAPPARREPPLAPPSTNGTNGDHPAISEHERAQELLADQAGRTSQTRRE